jgi:hypothetical protein
MDIFSFISLRPILELGEHNIFYIFWFFFKYGGWVFVLYITWNELIKEVWLNWRQDKYAATVKWIYLAIDVPRDNEQSPKAVEQIFNQIWGYKSGANMYEKWWKGIFLQSISLEIVSIEGYVQYIIRAPKIFKDLIESAVYAQYPEADISEIEDYTEEYTPDNFVEKGYKMWGTQFELVNSEFYPIKTYPLFEHSITQKIVDPLSAMIEMMSNLGKGEMLWYQIIIRATDDKWRDDAMEEVKELTGQDVEKKHSKLDKILEKIYITFGFMFPGHKTGEEKKSELPSKVWYMTKGDLETVNAIEIKSSKTGFKTKMRMLYFGKKDVFSKPRGVSPFVGALRQYAANNLNGFKPSGQMTTKADYLRADQRVYKKQKKILKQYKSRSIYAGTQSDGYLLNVEELASLYHFPSIEVSTTAVRTADSKKAPAPMSVPIPDELEEVLEPEVKENNKKNKESIKVGPPGNLPM